ncbi:MAG TPA: hypothetical protein VJ816_09305 [Gemmatimonadales bacterium]|nr:hypothetical protein [Gemmatimonadales bacterium]
MVPWLAVWGVWVYAYEIVPPQSKRRLEAIRALLDREHATARQGGRTWASRLVSERRATRILIVSDSPDQERAAVAAELARQQLSFTRTASMEISA